MKKPDLYFNHYYPFYTIRETGVKKHYRSEEVVMHLSPKRGIKAIIYYEKMRVQTVKLRFIDDASFLYNHDKDYPDITYRAFATHIKTIFSSIEKALKILQSEPCYIETLIFSNLLKLNNEVEFKAKYSEIDVSFSNPNYSIMDGKKVRIERDHSEHELLDRLTKVVTVIDDYTKVRVVPEEEFKRDFDYFMKSFIPYLEAPKFIRKKEYSL
jgi:uncharacterized protein (DUF1499 family)